MGWTYENVTPIVPNTVMRKGYLNGVHKVYRIAPATGYVMHDSSYDTLIYEDIYDDNGNLIDSIPTGEAILGYRSTEGSVGFGYDWTTSQMQDEAGNTVTAYGSRQLFCKLATDVPSDQIFGVPNEPEII